MIKPLIVGNWKMNGTQSQCFDLARKIAQNLRRKPSRVEVVLAPPYTALAQVKRAIENSNIKLAGQDSHWEESGAFTGEISPVMLKDTGCEFVILGHSERRHILQESDIMIAKKLNAALRNGLRPILCVGETLAERGGGRTATVIARQLRIALKGLAKGGIDQLDIAYEPVWAIGTGQTATPSQISQVHKRIRQFLKRSFSVVKANRMRILYGGSVNADNALTLMKTPEVSGLLVGGASLKAETFLPVIRCLDES
jgi:triosephosphate isomerase (TIM)